MNRYLDLLINTPPRFYQHTLKYKLAEKNEPENYNDIKPCAFVLSTGRAGTETLARLLETDKHLIAVHEPLPKLFGLSKTCYDLSEHFSADLKVNTALIEAFLTGRRDLLNSAVYTGRGYIETGPHVTFATPWILQAIPKTKFVHLLRAPKAMVTSGIRRNWYAGQINDQWRITPKPGTPFAKLWDEFNQEEKLLWLWAETNHWSRKFTETLDINQYLQVKSEDIFTGNETIIRELFKFLGLQIPIAGKIKRVLRKQINAQKTGSVNLQKNWKGEINANLFNFVSEVEFELGYPT